MGRLFCLSVVATVALALVVTGCETMETRGAAPAGPAVAPVVKLERVDVNHIQPFFVNPRIGFKDCNEPGKTMGGGYTSTLSLAYILSIHNPNSFPVMLDELRFTAAFEDFDVNMANVYEKQWIPAGKTNELRVVVVQEAAIMIGALSVGGMAAAKIKQMGTTQAAVVQKWFDTVGDFAFPIKVKEGVAVFKTPDGKSVMSNFQGVFPPPEKK